MTTSKIRASLFCKEKCKPCADAKRYIFDHFYEDEADFPLLDNFTLFRKEDHPALVASFDLKLFPTLIIHQDGKEIDRVVGCKNICRNIRYLLTEINQTNYENS